MGQVSTGFEITVREFMLMMVQGHALAKAIEKAPPQTIIEVLYHAREDELGTATIKFRVMVDKRCMQEVHIRAPGVCDD